MLGDAVSPSGEDVLTVSVLRDGDGYGMKVSGDNPVYVQSVKEHGAAWRAGLRAGDRILRVGGVLVHHHTHQQVVQMIRANVSTSLTVVQNSSRHKTPITAPVPVNSEKQRQLEVSKGHTMRLMLEKEQKYIRDLRNELSKVPDVRKQTQLESAEQRCALLQHQIDSIAAGQPLDVVHPSPSTPRAHRRSPAEKSADSPPSGFLSGLPRSLSNLTGQSLRNLRQARQAKPDAQRQSLDGKHRHNNTDPIIPVTCLDNVTPPPLPPRSIERPKRPPHNLNPVNPLANPKPGTSPGRPYYRSSQDNKAQLMHQSMPSMPKLHRSSHSLDEEGPQPNSIALQMNYPLVNVPPPPLKTDTRSHVPVLHVRSQSSPEHLEHGASRYGAGAPAWERAPPPGTPPPPYAHNTQPCADPQRQIISMEEDDSPSSDNSTYSGLFSNLLSVRESKARTAILLNWLLIERRCASANLLLLITDEFRAAEGAGAATLRRWAYEIHSTFLTPDAVLQLNGVDENMANEIEHVLVNEYEKEELVRNVFRKARQKAKEEMSQQLTEFQVKRQVGLGALYGPDDALIHKCEVDKAQEQAVVERIMTARLSAAAEAARAAPAGAAGDAPAALLAALLTAALCLHCRPASVSAAASGSRAAFLLRDKPYKQRLKQLAKQHPQPFVVRGHRLQPLALSSRAHCHRCDLPLAGLAPQAYVCADCELRVHRWCARAVEEPCCLDQDHHNNRLSRFMERMHAQNAQDTNDKKSRKTSANSHFLNMERSARRAEDEPPCEPAVSPPVGEPRREGSTEDNLAPEGDLDAGDNNTKDVLDRDTKWHGAGGRVNRAESCRERDAPRRGKHRNASDPNRLTAHHHHDLEPGAATAPSGSSSSSSLSTRSNESNTVAEEHQASQSDWSEEEEPLAAQWADSLPPHALGALDLSARERKRQEVIHELIVSEGSHVRWLKVLNFVFLRSLESQPALLPAEELRALFPNLPAVRERHAKLYAELRAARGAGAVPLRPVAAALTAALGEPGYASCLARFCRGQRMALDALRERRRKHKELHVFLHAREQLPLCGRLQLRDLLACVWQRLTKYQLLLESIVKTVEEDEEGSSEARAALAVAKKVLLAVDTAIRCAENEHRLKTIQSKLEVRASGPEWEELRRLELTQRALRMEGELALRYDSNKKTNVLALMFPEALVLLQREGDRFVLKPFSQPSQISCTLLSPLIKWEKVLFRPNAAVRNTFFLMNINGVQMHELSATSAAEYATWIKHIQEAPLARLAEAKPAPAHHHSRSNDDSGINVSRNPSDASEKSTSTAAEESERDRVSLERSSVEREEKVDKEKEEKEEVEDKEEKEDVENEEDDKERQSVEKEEVVEEEKHKVRRAAQGRISRHSGDAALEARSALQVAPPAALAAHTALPALTPYEQLRRLDASIAAALQAKSAVVGALLGVPDEPAASLAQLEELAVADTLGQLDGLGSPIGDDLAATVDVHQLLLAAQAQANQLCGALGAALNVSAAGAVAARAPRPPRARARCAACAQRESEERATEGEELSAAEPPQLEQAPQPPADAAPDSDALLSDDIYDEFEAVGAARLAARLAGGALGLQRALARLVVALPPLARAARAQRRDRADRDHHRHHHRSDHQMIDEISFPSEGARDEAPEQPSTGG